MPNTYTQVHIQAIFAAKFRAGLIQPSWKDELYKYITGIVRAHHHKLLVINGMPDHIHVFFGMRPTQSISDLLQDIKSDSSRFINDRRFLKPRFEWQSGYGAFSYSKSQVDRVVAYVNDQEIHHRKEPFLSEYKRILTAFGVDYDPRYIFSEPI